MAAWKGGARVSMMAAASAAAEGFTLGNLVQRLLGTTLTMTFTVGDKFTGDAVPLRMADDDRKRRNEPGGPGTAVVERRSQHD